MPLPSGGFHVLVWNMALKLPSIPHEPGEVIPNEPGEVERRRVVEATRVETIPLGVTPRRRVGQKYWSP